MFIANHKALLFVLRLTCLAAVFPGAQVDFGLVWNLADVTMGFMVIVSIIAIFILERVAFKVLDYYEQQRKAGKKPVFYEDEVDIQGTVWKRNND